MTRSIRGSHYHHRPNRRGSYGDGSFNENYRSSPVASHRFIGSRIQPLLRDSESTASNDQARQEIEGQQFRAGDFEVYQNKRLTSTIPKFLQTSLRSIGELEFYDNEDEDDDDEDYNDDDESLQYLETTPYTLTSSLRSMGMSIRSLPREIELLDQENFDHSSLRSEDDDFCVATTQPMDLQSSLRSVDAFILSLPREKELSHDESHSNKNHQGKDHQGKEEEEHEQESFATSKCISSRASFVQRGDTASRHLVDTQHSQLQIDALVEESLDDMRYKVYSMEVVVANMNENLVDMRRRVVSMESVVDTMNENLAEMRQNLISVESIRNETMVLYRNKSLPIAREVLEQGDKPSRFPRAA